MKKHFKEYSSLQESLWSCINLSITIIFFLSYFFEYLLNMYFDLNFDQFLILKHMCSYSKLLQEKIPKDYYG